MYKKILVAIDGSKTSERALTAAIDIACQHDAELRPLYVIDNPVVAYESIGADPSGLHDAFVAEGEELAKSARAEMATRGVRGSPEVIEVTGVGEDIAQRIFEAAAKMAPDLVVLGTHGRRGFRRLFLGSVAERFVRLSSWPVLLIPSEQHAHAGAAQGDSPATRQTGTQS